MRRARSFHVWCSRNPKQVVVPALILGISASCSLNPYTFRTEGDGGSIPEAGFQDGRPDRFEPDACIAQPEVCNQRDDDCDGLTDEDFNLDSDPENCGQCGHVCERPNSWGTCVSGQCQYECQSGFYDLDGDPDNGCEYPCVPTYGGTEQCDGYDNDCDGLTDEDFDLNTDPENCGQCGRVCQGVHADASCVDGECVYTCESGYADLLPDVPGCEYECPVYPPEPERCNFVDDDCDGEVDEDDPEGGGPCGETQGTCQPGTLVCQYGNLVCQGGQGPENEVCDDRDNDCDGLTDEDFDKQNDPNHCGSCDPCTIPNAVAGCSGGHCVLVSCLAGWVDANGDPSDGCEYQCTPNGPEVCDGRDNDCNGLTDTADPGLVQPPNFCRQDGPCAGAVPQCTATACDPEVKWRCLYHSPAEVDSCGNLLPQETLCDDVDGNCDGRTDETFLLKGTPCHDDGIGACMGTGVYVCDATGTGLACQITNPGATPMAEVCNGIDDDCDGQTDEQAQDSMVHVTAGGLDFWMDVYEASRPDATASSPGTMTHRACSNPNVLPWRNLDWNQAAQACAAAGKRLCTEEEWQAACEGPSAMKYPYGDTYQPDYCNTKDYDPDCTPPDDDALRPTGEAFGCPPPQDTRCISDWGIIDMSGNLAEWTDTQVSNAPVTYRIRGGAYDNIDLSTTCQFDFVSAEPDFHYDDLGFRCCADTRPW